MKFFFSLLSYIFVNETGSRSEQFRGADYAEHHCTGAPPHGIHQDKPFKFVQLRVF